MTGIHSQGTAPALTPHLLQLVLRSMLTHCALIALCTYRKVIKQKIAGYLKRAETLKAEIAASPAVQVRSACCACMCHLPQHKLIQTKPNHSKPNTPTTAGKGSRSCISSQGTGSCSQSCTVAKAL